MSNFRWHFVFSFIHDRVAEPFRTLMFKIMTLFAKVMICGLVMYPTSTRTKELHPIKDLTFNHGVRKAHVFGMC